jgi:hypothetical protein
MQSRLYFDIDLFMIFLDTITKVNVNTYQEALFMDEKIIN